MLEMIRDSKEMNIVGKFKKNFKVFFLTNPPIQFSESTVHSELEVTPEVARVSGETH